MLKTSKIIKIADAVAKANLKPKSVTAILTEPATDSEGHDALRITIVIKPGPANRPNGDAALNTLVQMQSQLRDAGEERFPIVEYATKEELAVSGDPES